MHVTIRASFGCLLLLFAGATLADCARPRPKFQVPAGNSVNQEELTATQQQLVSFAQEVGDYLRCMNGEVSQKSVGKDEAARTQLAQAHVTAHQEAANELAGLADCYAAQVEVFKTSGGGTQRQSVDCGSYIAAAAQRTQGSAPTTTELIVEASGASSDLPTGNWIYYLVRDDAPRRCMTPEPAECLYRAVHVRNDSDETLECKGEITYDGTDAKGSPTSRAQILVGARATYVVVASLAKTQINAKTFDAQCTARAKLPPLDTPATCKYEVVKPISIGDYYPEGSREAGEQGPVVVEFTLPGKAASPRNVKVVAGSMFSALDQAAVKAVGDMVMSSSCPNSTYRLRVSFQLQ